MRKGIAVNISINGGKDEMGDNEVLLKHEGATLKLDFGMSFKQRAQHYCDCPEMLLQMQCSLMR